MLSFSDYAGHDATGLAELVRTRAVGSGELLEVALASLDALHPTLNLVAHDLRDDARNAACDADAAFAGVPFMVKDLSLAMAGVPNEAGSRLLKGNIAARSHNLVPRFRAAGLVTIARTTTAEFGAQLSTESILTGVTRNPWSLDHTPGGSSGGSAAAVASGVVPLAHANDGIGSIRVPAANCGLFGLKLTRQRAPCGPDEGETIGGRGSEFALTTTVRDAAGLLDCIHGADVGAPSWAPPPLSSYRAVLDGSVASLRVALLDQSFSGKAVHPACAASVRNAGELAEALGHVVEHCKPDFSWDAYSWAIRTEALTNFSAGMDYFAELTGRRVGGDTLEPLNLLAYEEGKRTSLRDYLKSIAIYGRTQRDWGRFFENFDVLITPVLSRPTARIGELGHDKTDFEKYWEQFAGDAYSPFTGVFNVTGHPAASIPFGFDSDGLPLGIQIVGRFGREDLILALARQIEQARPWRHLRPTAHISRMPM